MRISVVFPCFNDAGTIASMVLMADGLLKEIEHEIIVINDGSTDYSPLILKYLEEKVPSLKVIHHRENKGYGAALIHGFKNAKYEYVFYTDGDAQYDITSLPRFIKAMDENTDMVQGHKKRRRDPLYRIILGSIYRLMVKWIFKIKIVKDVDCDFRLFRRDFLEKLNLHINSGAICVEMVKKAEIMKGRIKQMPVDHFYRPFRFSQFFRIKNLFNLLLDLFRFWMELKKYKK